MNITVSVKLNIERNIEHNSERKIEHNIERNIEHHIGHHIGHIIEHNIGHTIDHKTLVTFPRAILGYSDSKCATAPFLVRVLILVPKLHFNVRRGWQAVGLMLR